MPSQNHIFHKLDDKPVHRAVAEIPTEFEKRNEFFLSPTSREYDKQYFSMYQYRLTHLKNRVTSNALKKWGDGVKTIDGQTIYKQDKILDIKSGKLCWVVGTVFCDAKYKLNILNDVEKGTDDVLPLVPVSYLDENDEQPVVMLEDESGRAVLHNEEFLNRNLLVTGCIVAVLGIEVQAGIFEIMDVAYPECAPQKPLSPPQSRAKKIAIVSGLNIGAEGDYDLKIELLKQFLLGETGSSSDSEYSSNIARLIIAGDSIEPIRDVAAEEDLRNFVTTNNYGSKNITKYTTESLQKLDNFINEVIVNLPISIMPGDHDPSEICIPQQPLHRSIFKSSLSLVSDDRLERLTNPVWLEIDGVKILGTSGQNVNDVKRYMTRSTAQDSMKIMKSSMSWQNFVPTAPDTLYCYPYDDYDPFIFTDTLPHVYFAGNQTKYEADTYTCPESGSKVSLVSIPEFKTTGEFVVFDLGTMQSEVVKVKIT